MSIVAAACIFSKVMCYFVMGVATVTFNPCDRWPMHKSHHGVFASLHFLTDLVAVSGLDISLTTHSQSQTVKNFPC